MGGIIAIIAAPVIATLLVGFEKLPVDLKYCYKWIASYVCIQLHKLTTRKRFDYYDMQAENDPVKTNFLPHPEEEELESPLSDQHLLNGADEAFFHGVNSKSECIIVRIARGTNDEAEAWIYLKLSNGKIYQLTETLGYQQSSCDKRAFTCGGLQFYYMSPMRRWRIFFNGLLRETNDAGDVSGKMVHVKFAVIWRSSSDAFDFMSDVNDRALSKALAKAKWNSLTPPLKRLKSAWNLYGQSGTIVGTVNIEGEDDDYKLYLFGQRMRFIGDTSLIKNAEFFHLLGQTSKNGRYVHIARITMANVVENLIFGFVVQPTGKIDVITDTSIPLEKFSATENEIETKFHADGELFELKGAVLGKQSEFHSNKGWDGHLAIDYWKFKLNDFEGSGVVLNGKITSSSKRLLSKSAPNESPAVVPLVVHFSEKICQISDITGGKGSSLGKLTELSRDFQNFIVPNGIVVTTAAFGAFLNKDVLNEIKNLENVLYKEKNGDIKGACQRVVDEVIKSSIPDPIRVAIITNLQKAFPNQTQKFAVRSSATGEDTEQMSAAGQMETYLGVSGIDEILTSVKKCWASQFTHIAVQYKRQNGQVINSPMAVVIQQMISCDVAGVLFTCDPLTGNPTTMSITANYGLGESVVSGSEEPDSIEISRREDDLVITNKTIGSKRRRIIIKDDGGTDLQEMSEKEKTVCCLTDEMSLRLGHLAVKIEKSYRSYRDIEWGFWNNNLYIFQSRPVTSGSGESDFEIEHELDEALRAEDDYFTVCNVGEVMPGASSPLGLDVYMKQLNLVFQKGVEFGDFKHDNLSKYFYKGIMHFCNHVMFNAIDLLQHNDEVPNATEGLSIAMFGRVIEDEQLFEMVRERHARIKKRQSSFKESIKRLIRVIYGSKKSLKKSQKTYAEYRMTIEKCKNAAELWEMFLNSCTYLSEGWTTHLECTESSSLLNMFVFGIIRNSNGELNADVYSDFAHLATTSSTVESADVPSAIEHLAYLISKDIKTDDFKKMNANEALEWIDSSSRSSGKAYKEFLKRHGHRCLREFDIRSIPWGANPNSLIPLLQNLAGSAKKDKNEKQGGNIKNLLAELKTPLNWKNKIIMRLVLPMCRLAVQNRETSKSTLVKGVNAGRMTLRQLARTMVVEGRIPDEDLLYFMTLEEIKELLNTRSPKIISKANHRRRRYPAMDKYIFPEIMKGYPTPVNMEKTPLIVINDGCSMKGIPVSQGIAKGFVRVALDLEEASHIQPGEILVTYSTDIGWSPYFPILGGVVTELGGLISHGAVVSREYGLPCVAGMHGATRQFQTGDFVLLDGNKGILQKLQKQED